jgi:hypothetical protein
MTTRYEVITANISRGPHLVGTCRREGDTQASRHFAVPLTLRNVRQACYRRGRQGASEVALPTSGLLSKFLDNATRIGNLSRDESPGVRDAPCAMTWRPLVGEEVGE